MLAAMESLCAALMVSRSGEVEQGLVVREVKERWSAVPPLATTGCPKA